jgi:hypothetical protein
MFPFRSSAMKQLLSHFSAASISASAEDQKTADAFHDAAAKANSILTLPDWDQTPEAVEGR